MENILLILIKAGFSLPLGQNISTGLALVGVVDADQWSCLLPFQARAEPENPPHPTCATSCRVLGYGRGDETAAIQQLRAAAQGAGEASLSIY